MQPATLELAKTWLKNEKGLFIDGQWEKPILGKTFSSINPSNGEVLATLSEASRVDVDRAVGAAEKAFLLGPWKTIKRRERAATLNAIANAIRSHRAELATLESLDNGKTYQESYFDDLPESADVFDYYAGWIDKYYSETCPVENGFVNFTRREPLGVCALIVPWNFPLLLATWKLAPALAMGNTVVIKPSPFTSLTLIRLFEILDENKILPKGVMNLVTGGNESGEALSTHMGVSKISFTGSTPIGKRIVEGSAKSNLKSVSLELGGKSANIVFDDVTDINSIVERGFTAMFSHKGEKCSEPTRFFLHEKIYSPFVDLLVKKTAAVICGNPFDPKTHQGPQCHEGHLEKILSYVKIGKEEGAKLLIGGERDLGGNNAKGFFFRPAIFGEVSHRSRLAQEEIFGPVLAVTRFKTEEEVLMMANDSIYGLAAGFYTNDASRVHRVANQLEAGMVFVNHYGCYDFASPFGGVKQSGWGKEMALHSLDAYTRLKSIWIRY